jgi:hypothetical protein
MGCPGCEQQQQSKNQELQAIRTKAIEDAKKNKTAYGIYEEAGEYKYIRYDLAARLPILQIVSQYSQLTTG